MSRSSGERRHKSHLGPMLERRTQACLGSINQNRKNKPPRSAEGVDKITDGSVWGQFYRSTVCSSVPGKEVTHRTKAKD
jgi:hypothetical protein